MIADFRFDTNPSPEAISVRLFWLDGKEMGELQIPSDVREFLRSSDAPDPGQMPMFSALSYALYVAGTNSLKMTITGDKSVWCDCWGRLIEAH